MAKVKGSKAARITLTGQERYAITALARHWEQFSAKRLGHYPRIIDPQLRQVKPEYERTFVRLLAVCDEMHLSPPETYFGLLFDALTERENKQVFTKMLGGPYCNSLVEQGRQIRSEQFSGREDRETLAYRAPTPGVSSLAPESLEREWAKFMHYRHQYTYFPRGRFWLFFVGEFSGTFLFMNEEYRASGLDLLLHLTPTQLGEWKALEQDPRLRQSIATALMTIASEGAHGLLESPAESERST